MVPMFLAGVNGHCCVAVVPTEIMVPRFPRQGVDGNRGVALGPIEAMVPWLPRQKVSVH